MKSVGLIGCGAIGTVLAEAIERQLVICDELIVFDVDRGKAERLKAALNFPVTIVTSFEDFLKSKPSVIVEAASQQAAKEYAPRYCEDAGRVNRYEHGGFAGFGCGFEARACSIWRHRRPRRYS